MAAIGVALWKHVMQYAPHTPDFVNRDRFVLSNGHTCLFQYVFLHLSGFKAMTMDQLKSYHSKRYDALCPGHPEIEHEGVEVTTGPLGQGGKSLMTTSDFINDVRLTVFSYPHSRERSRTCDRREESQRNLQ